jgi:hypothetical protein
LKINSVAFAEQVGVSKSAVTQAVKDGRLYRTSEGMLDTENILNAKYLRERRSKVAYEKMIRRPQKPTTQVAPIAPRLPEGLEPETDDRAYRLSVEIGGVWLLVVRYIFDENDNQEDEQIGALPKSVKIDWLSSNRPRVFDAETGENYPCYDDAGPEARARVEGWHA